MTIENSKGEISHVERIKISWWRVGMWACVFAYVAFRMVG